MNVYKHGGARTSRTTSSSIWSSSTTSQGFFFVPFFFFGLPWTGHSLLKNLISHISFHFNSFEVGDRTVHFISFHFVLNACYVMSTNEAVRELCLFFFLRQGDVECKDCQTEDSVYWHEQTGAIEATPAVKPVNFCCSRNCHCTTLSCSSEKRRPTFKYLVGHCQLRWDSRGGSRPGPRDPGLQKPWIPGKDLGPGQIPQIYSNRLKFFAIPCPETSCHARCFPSFARIFLFLKRSFSKNTRASQG
jgi:hypothetical protein